MSNRDFGHPVRNSFLTINFNPDHSVLTAQILVSTNPVAKNRCWTTSKSSSVADFAAFFGQQIQSEPSDAKLSILVPAKSSNPALVVTKATTILGEPTQSLESSEPSGRPLNQPENSSGAFTVTTVIPSLIPNLAQRGLPE